MLVIVTTAADEVDVKPIACKLVSALIAAETPVAIVVNVADVGTKYPTTSCPPVNFDERKTNLKVSPVVTVPPTVALILPETFEPKVTASFPPADVGLAAPAYVVKLLEDDVRLRTLAAAVHETPIPESIESEAIAVDSPDAIDVRETPLEGTVYDIVRAPPESAAL